MLFLRCTHRRPCYTLLHEFHRTRPHLRRFGGAFQIDPFTAQARAEPDLKPSSPSRLRPQGHGRKTKKLRAGRQRIEKSDEKGCFSEPPKLQIHNRSVYPRVVEGDHGMGCRFARNKKGRQSSQSAPTEREAHPSASGNAAQSVPDDKGSTPHRPSLLLFPHPGGGVIPPRASGGPFLKDVLPPSSQSPVATLAHGLERVLFNPGVQWLQHPRSQVYSFTTWLGQIIPVRNFAFERLKSFVPSSRDEDLHAIAQREGRKYAGSTSSLSGLLRQLYYLISGDKPINTSKLSDYFRNQPRTFTPGQRAPASVVLNYRNGVYLIDSAHEAVPGTSSKNVLTWMGTLLEKFLTHTPEEFLRLVRSVDVPTVVAEDPRNEAYRYAKSDKFVLRSQLDCFDSRLPGTGVFDIKTRAVTSIRHDVLNFEESSGYQIRTVRGYVESFEKEYYDLIRSAFLKYSFQARIGNMDGVFVAYHNTERIFGFQYIPLCEMDARLFGERASGNAVFEKCMLLLEVILEEATRELPCQSIRLTAEKRGSEDNLKVFLEPAAWDEELHGSRPVIQLDVSIQNYIGERATDGSSAVERSSLPWTLRWSISKSTREHKIVRDDVAGARRRSFFKLSRPNGVTEENMEEFWHGLQFNPAAPVEVPFMADMFCRPPKHVKNLRRLSRKGRVYLRRSKREQEGRPPFVRGIPNDAQTVAPLMELAHGPPSSAQVVKRWRRRNRDNSATTTLSDKLRGLGCKQQSPDMPLTSVASKNQKRTTRKAMAPFMIDPLTATSFVMAKGDGKDLIPKTMED